MPTRSTNWPAGTPCWVDAQVDDQQAAIEFYGHLFGWQAVPAPSGRGDYFVAHKDDQTVAGIGPKPPGMELPCSWTVYLAADDCAAGVRAAGNAGGRFPADPVDVGTAGRMAVGIDGAGAALGLWQGRDHIGFTLFNEPGAVCWTELHTRTYDVSKDFYAKAFDFTFTEIGDGDVSYSTFAVGGAKDSLGGVQRDETIPDGLPNYWLVWFATDDCDRTAQAASDHGGNVLMTPSDSPFGRVAVVQGPQGEVFGIIDTQTASQ